MVDLVELLRWLTLVAFVVLAAITFRLWARRRDETSRWAFLTFLVLAVVVVAARALPEPDRQPWEFIRTLNVGVLLLFPYFLYRTAASFRAATTIFDRVAGGLTLVVVAWALALPGQPAQGEPQPGWYRLFIAAVLVQWTVISVAVAREFWSGGRDQPALVRTRMRLLSAASLTLSLAIILAGAVAEASEDVTEPPLAIAATVQLLALLSALGFLVSFDPPRWLRAAWRSEGLERARSATIELMEAQTRDEVITSLLPRAAELIAARGIVLRDPEGDVVATHGLPAVLTPAEGDDLVTFDYPFGSVTVLTTSYTPFFGREEMQLIGSLGAFANLALQRLEANEMRIQLEAAEVRRRQALEINDNVVQGLAVAQYSFEIGDMDKASDAIDGTLAAARGIISKLVDEIGADKVFGGETPVREEPATGYGRPQRPEEKRRS